jgi:hypothetical protein
MSIKNNGKVTSKQTIEEILKPKPKPKPKDLSIDEFWGRISELNKERSENGWQAKRENWSLAKKPTVQAKKLSQPDSSLNKSATFPTLSDNSKSISPRYSSSFESDSKSGRSNSLTSKELSDSQLVDKSKTDKNRASSDENKKKVVARK